MGIEHEYNIGKIFALLIQVDKKLDLLLNKEQTKDRQDKEKRIKDSMSDPDDISDQVQYEKEHSF
jgi:hypothetical protein